MESQCLPGSGFLFGRMRFWRWMVVTVAQHRKCAQCHWPRPRSLSLPRLSPLPRYFPPKHPGVLGLGGKRGEAGAAAHRWLRAIARPGGLTQGAELGPRWGLPPRAPPSFPVSWHRIRAPSRPSSVMSPLIRRPSPVHPLHWAPRLPLRPRPGLLISGHRAGPRRIPSWRPGRCWGDWGRERRAAVQAGPAGGLPTVACSCDPLRRPLFAGRGRSSGEGEGFADGPASR